MKPYERIVYTTAEGLELGGVFLSVVDRPACYRGPDVTLYRIHLDTMQGSLTVNHRSVRPFGYETSMKHGSK
jgi:hypothetical protein